MLTFSEALSLLKAGQDMRVKGWPTSQFVRVVIIGGTPRLVVFKGPSSSQTAYQFPSAEVFGQTWSIA